MAAPQNTGFRPGTKGSAPARASRPGPTGGAATARLRQRFGAAALVLAPLCLAGSIFYYAVATPNGGGNDMSGAASLALMAAHPALHAASISLAVLGCLLLVPALMTAMRLLRPGSPRLSLVAGSMMVAGYCCYVYAVGGGSLEAAMARDPAHLDVYASAMDATQELSGADWPFVWPFLVFVAGNILGTALLAVAVIRSRAVHWWAGAAVAAWPVSHIVGLSVNSEWFELGGSLLQLAGFTAMAVAVLRTPAGRWDYA